MNEKSDFRLIGWVSILYFVTILLVGSFSWIIYLLMLYQFKKLLNIKYNYYTADKYIWIIIVTNILTIVISNLIIARELFIFSSIIIRGLSFFFIGSATIKINDKLIKYLSYVLIIMGIYLELFAFIFLSFYIFQQLIFYQVLMYSSFLETIIQIVFSIVLGVNFLKAYQTNNLDDINDINS